FQRLYSWLLALFWATKIDVTMLGLQNSGKTSLLRVLAGNEFALDSIPTVGFNIKSIRKGKMTMRCWDMGGQPRFRSMWQRYCRGTDAIVFVIDSADAESFSVAKDELHLLLKDANLEGISLLVLCNKTDLEEKLSAREILEELEMKNLRGRSLACYEVSAKEAINLDLVLKWLVNRGGHKKQQQESFREMNAPERVAQLV
ncbi:P-loop containing nucleoside triphosphate hydrolase protein, partial [Leptodontidium sp. 2 PMI_412]